MFKSTYKLDTRHW